MTIEEVLSRYTEELDSLRVFNAIHSLDQRDLRTRIRRMPYRQFLDTAYWKAVSGIAMANAQCRCQLCNTSTCLAVHHRTYDTHGEEHRNLIDLIVLCHACHQHFHVPTIEKEQDPPQLEIQKPPQPGIEVPASHIVLTKKMIAACKTTRGGFTGETVKAFGLKWSELEHGWPKRLVGTSITTEAYNAALLGRTISRNNKNRPLDVHSHETN